MPHFNKNYFQLFNLPEYCELDLESLAEVYRGLQREVHPDRFANADEQTKLLAVQSSGYLNEAYNTLKSPLKRVGYLLTLQGQDIEQVNQNELSMEMLLEQIQLREALEEMPEDESALVDLASLREDVKAKLDACHRDFADKLKENNIDGAKKIYHELQFHYKLFAEIDSAEELRLGY